MDNIPNSEGYMDEVRSSKMVSGSDCHRFIDDMVRLIQTYGHASVNDFRYLCGLPARSYLEATWGWTDADEVFERSIIRRVPGEDSWELLMPRPQWIRASKTEPKTSGEVVNSTYLANLLIQARDLVGCADIDHNNEYRCGVIELVAETFELTFEKAEEMIMTTSTPDHPYQPVLTPSNAPAGLVVTIGHSANGRKAVKGNDGFWRNIDNGWVLDEEDFRAGWNPFVANIDGFQGYEDE